jgi:predicted outer membrane repeat protein
MDFGSKHRKRRWYTTAVGGLAGVTGLAALSLAASSNNMPGLGGLAGPRSALGQQFGTGGGDDSNGSKDGEYGKDHKVIKVDCKPDDLIAAVQEATLDGGAKLELAEKCTYTLTAFQESTFNNGPNGLPEIKAPVKINGNGSTITRAANAEDFRFFEVVPGGHLTLRDVTLKNGRNDVDGGALLVLEGGKASIENSKFLFNRSEDLGGAIANYGITKISGDDKGKDKADEKDKKKADPKENHTGDQWWSEDHYSNTKDGGDESHSLISRNFADNDGGALYNDGLMTIDRTRVSYNTSADDGGAFTNDQTAVVTNSVFDHNHAASDGGAIFVTEFAQLKVKDSYITDNTATDEGGGMFVDDEDTAYVWNTKILRNLAEGDGGGVSNEGTFTAQESKINLNETVFGMGGGLRNTGIATLFRTEVNQNRAFNGEGGGIDNGATGDLTLTKSKVIENYALNPAGGVDNNGDAEVDDETTIVENVPTNCQNVPNCFG